MSTIVILTAMVFVVAAIVIFPLRKDDDGSNNWDN